MSSVASDARVRPLKRAEYDRLVELAYFQDEKVELLDGVLVEMRPQGVPHANAIRVLGSCFATRSATARSSIHNCRSRSTTAASPSPTWR